MAFFTKDGPPGTVACTVNNPGRCEISRSIFRPLCEINPARKFLLRKIPGAKISPPLYRLLCFREFSAWLRELEPPSPLQVRYRQWLSSLESPPRLRGRAWLDALLAAPPHQLRWRDWLRRLCQRHRAARADTAGRAAPCARGADPPLPDTGVRQLRRAAVIEEVQAVLCREHAQVFV